MWNRWAAAFLMSLVLGTMVSPALAAEPEEPAPTPLPTEELQPEPEAEEEPGAALTPDGNLTLVDDEGDVPKAGKQFITLVTRSGNYFYLIIDRDDEGEETVHFLNQVDEADLMALMEEGEMESFPAPIPEITEPEETPEIPVEAWHPEDEPEDLTEQKENSEPEAKPGFYLRYALPLFLGILMLAGGGIGWLLSRKRVPKQENSLSDPDDDYLEDLESEDPDEEDELR